MDTTRYAKPRPCLPSLQRSRSSRTRVAAPGRARAVSLDEVSDRSLSRDDLVWETRMCLQPSTAPSIDDLGFDEDGRDRPPRRARAIDNCPRRLVVGPRPALSWLFCT